MDRKKQFSNVAFGGDWSDIITDREGLQADLGLIEAAVRDCREQDPRSQALRDALERIASRITRGDLLTQALWKAAQIPDQAQRAQQMERSARTIRSALGREIDG